VSEAIIDPKSQATPRIFPVPGTNLHRLLTDQEFKQGFRSRLKIGNPWMAFFYKLRLLPLLGMGKQIMLLTTLGRKSGKLRDTPIGYYRIGGQVYVFSGWGRDTNWFKNIEAHPDQVDVQIGFKRDHAHAEIVDDPREALQLLESFVVQNPKGAQMLMGWDPLQDDIRKADFSFMIERMLIVRFRFGEDYS
jgi:deazaflavin-dependent oxidoreductase (nitroreductase family)